MLPDPTNCEFAIIAGGTSPNTIGEPQGQIILKTIDGGATWTTLRKETALDGLWGLSFLDANNGVAVGDNSVIIRTTDGGANWTAIDTAAQNINPVILTSANWIDANTVWVGGEFYTPNPNGPATFLVSTDGGLTYTNTLANSTTITDDFLAICFLDATHGYGVGTLGAIYYTADGGISWVSQRGGASEGLNQASFVDANNGFAVGLAGLIVKTTDGGNSWTELGNNPAAAGGGMTDLLCVSFADTLHGWTGGTGGWVMRTIDGGANWTIQTSPITGDVTGIVFLDASNGFAVGDAGGFMRTTNGGALWTLVNTGTTGRLNACTFTSLTDGWAVGEAGLALHTTDGGDTWTQVTGIPNVPYLSVRFTGQDGLIAGENALCYTHDGGQTWSSNITINGAVNQLSTVYENAVFADANTAYAVTVGGDILKSVNGGSTWTLQYYFTPNPLYGINCLDANSVWIVGDGGYILWTASGGF